jgi:hypothetical protein
LGVDEDQSPPSSVPVAIPRDRLSGAAYGWSKIMRKLGIQFTVTLALGLAAAPLSPSFASGSSPGPTPDQQQLAFSLDEMNCFSSDIQARADTPEKESAEKPGIVIADERGGGSNGIPCAHRDPKSPPAWRNQS